MRINGISLNLGQRNNVNFGRFADENARKVVREALTTEAPDWAQFRGDYYFKRIEDCKFFEAYTADDGTVKGKFDDEFVKSEGGKKAGYIIETIHRHKTLDNLSTFDNADDIADRLRDIYKILSGIDLAEELRKWVEIYGSEEPEDYAAKRAEEEAYR